MDTIYNFENLTITKLALDNAAKIYPAAATKNWNAVFAVSAHLSEEVNPIILRAAVTALAKRFVSMYVTLKSEFFWDCLVPATDYNIVEKESNPPCRSFDLKEKNKPLFRVVYNGNEIRCEFFHSITDGTGAFEYLKALLLEYFELGGTKTTTTLGIKRADERFTDSEIRDDFQTISKKDFKYSRKDSNAYQVDLKREKGYLSRNIYSLDMSEIKRLTKEKYHCTITQYIASLYALALLENYKDSNSKKPVKLSIPVNLRPYFNSSTLRNFASFITINCTPNGEYNIENVLPLIKNAMAQKIKKENFINAVSQNIADENMFIAKYSPNKIKKLVMRSAFYLYGERKYTSTVTNIGNVILPPQLQGKVNCCSATLGETPTNTINCAVAGYNDTLCVTLTSVNRNMTIQNKFAELLEADGIFQTDKTKISPVAIGA